MVVPTTELMHNTSVYTSADSRLPWPPLPLHTYLCSKWVLAHGISPVLQCPTDSVGHVAQPPTGSYWYEPPDTTAQGQWEITAEQDEPQKSFHLN